MRKTIVLILAILAASWNLSYAQEGQTPAKPSHVPSKKKHKSPKDSKPGFTPIEIHEVGPAQKLSVDYYHEGLHLKSYQDFQSVIDPLGDEAANRFLKSSRDKDSGAVICDVLGCISAGSGLIYAVAAQPTTTSGGGGFPFSGAIIQPADMTPAWILGGVGLALGLLALTVEDEAEQSRKDAVIRYNHVIGQDADQKAPVSSDSSEIKSETTLQPVSSSATGSPESGAVSTVAAGSAEKRFGFGIAPSLGFPLSNNTSSEYVPSLGIDVSVDLGLTKNFGLRLETGIQSYPVNTANMAKLFQQTYGIPLPSGVSFTGGWSNFPLLALVKYSIPIEKSKFTPYLFWGMGVDFNNADISVSYNSQSAEVATREASLLMSQGIGIGFRPSDDFEIFAQCRLDINYTSKNNSDTITLSSNGSTATAMGNLSDDSPTLFLPLQVGVRMWQ